MRVCLFLIMIACFGCQITHKRGVIKSESPQEIVSAMGVVARGLTNTDLSRENLKHLATQVQKDPQARSAVKAVNTAFSIQNTGVKYCPVDGKRYSSRVDECPEHKVKLLLVE